MYQQTYQIYSNYQDVPVKPEKFITEDSNSGFDFFKAVGRERGIDCKSAGGKSNIYCTLKENGEGQVCVIVIADGAAIGPEMDRLFKYASQKKNIYLYFPESFEWLILNSGVVPGKELQDMLIAPENYIDSKEYFSWERYFSRFLTDKTSGSYLQYGKSRLNEVYLHDKNKELILKTMKGLKLEDTVVEKT